LLIPRESSLAELQYISVMQFSQNLYKDQTVLFLICLCDYVTPPILGFYLDHSKSAIKVGLNS